VASLCCKLHERTSSRMTAIQPPDTQTCTQGPGRVTLLPPSPKGLSKLTGLYMARAPLLLQAKLKSSKLPVKQEWVGGKKDCEKCACGKRVLR